MATITTTPSGGDWLVGSTWVGGVVPVDGIDTVVVTNGATLTIAAGASVSIGTDGALNSVALTVNQGGTLNISGTLTMHGDLVQQRGSTVAGHAGGRINFDAPSAGIYYQWRGLGGSAGLATISSDAGLSNPFVISGATTRSGNKGYLNWDGALSFLYFSFNFNGVRFEDLGDSTTARAIYASNWAAGSLLNLDNAIFLRCYAVSWSRGVNGTANYGTINIRYPTYTADSVNAFLITEQSKSTTPKTITSINVYNDTVTKALLLINLENVTIDRAVIMGLYMTISFKNAVIKRSFLHTIPFWVTEGGNVAYNNVWYVHQQNPHCFHDQGVSAGNGANLVHDMVFDADGHYAVDTGDLYPALGAVTFRNNIAINEAGVLVTPQSNNVRFTVHNNTTYKSYGLVNGEGLATPDAYVSVQNNLISNQAEGMHQLMFHQSFPNSTVVDYNGSFNIANGYTLYNYPQALQYSCITHPTKGFLSYVGAEKYQPWITGKSYGDVGFGANDISADPMFVDPTRTVRGWGGWSSFTDAVRELVTVGGVDYQGNPTTPTTRKAEDCVAYIQAGFTPQNPVYRGAGYGGADIGAVAVQVPAVTPTRRKPFSWGFGWGF